MNSVADSEHRHAEIKNLPIRNRCSLGKNRTRSSLEYDPDNVIFTELGGRSFVVIDFLVNLGFANPARDDLSVLRTEIEDGDSLWHTIKIE